LAGAEELARMAGILAALVALAAPRFSKKLD
jgi:hypothetical protein